MLGAILAELRKYTCNLRMGFHDNGKGCEPHSVMWFVEKLLRAFQTASCNNREILFSYASAYMPLRLVPLLSDHL
jgi:hypothetical protein